MTAERRKTLRLDPRTLTPPRPAPFDIRWQHVGRSRENTRLSGAGTPPPLQRV